MYIIFENEFGNLRIAGGGRDTWMLIEADGLDIAKYDTQTTYIKGREGRTTLSMQSLERSITLKGDIIAKNSNQLVTKAAQILDAPGRLKITNGSKKRMIDGRCTAFYTEKERGGIRPFVMQFICDDPFFTDFDKKEVDLATIEKLLYGTLDLREGICFSSGRTRAMVINGGVKNSEPIINISCKTDIKGNAITINNYTTGQVLTINHALKNSDSLVIDTPERKVVLNGEQRFDLLATDSFLSEFYIAPGSNDVEIVTNSNSDRLTAYISFYNKYNEAMG